METEEVRRGGNREGDRGGSGEMERVERKRRKKRRNMNMWGGKWNNGRMKREEERKKRVKGDSSRDIEKIRGRKRQRGGAEGKRDDMMNGWNLTVCGQPKE